MPFCSKCGADVSGVASCPQCGTAAEGQPAGDPSEAPTTPQGTPQAAPAAQSLPDNVAGALAYVTPIPAIIFLLIDPFKTIRFVRFHSLQSIVFCLTAFVFQFAIMIVSVVLSFVGVGFIIGLLSTLISLGIFVLWIILVIKAYQGQEFQLPVISGLAAKWL